MQFIFPLFTNYLFLPLMMLLMAIPLSILNRKSQLMSNVRLVVTVLIGGLILGLPGFLGLIDLWFMPGYYVANALINLILGIVFLRYLLHDLGPAYETRPLFTVLLGVVMMALGIYLYALIFNYFGTLKYGYWAATCLLPFLAPALFSYAFIALVSIPNEIYKLWYYPRRADEIVLEGVDYYRLMILEVQVRKHPTATGAPIKVKARTTADMPFGMWFQKFIDDYNYKFPNDPIKTLDNDTKEYGWLFYSLKPSIFRLRHYIDFDQTIAQNKLREDYLIVAKRVQEIN
jgi:hypothetical protein